MTDCVFCQVLAGTRDAGAIAYQDEWVALLPSREQRSTNLGHMLLVTTGHFPNLYEMPSSLDGSVMAVLRRAALAVERAFDAPGTSIGQNNGPPGQDVFHVHFHVIPRFHGDGGLSGDYQVVALEARLDQARRVALAFVD